jgi:hypothetical protein
LAVHIDYDQHILYCQPAAGRVPSAAERLDYWADRILDPLTSFKLRQRKYEL